MSERKSILADIELERERQAGIWDDSRQDPINFPGYIQDYAAWARIKIGSRNYQEARERLVQVAALAVATIERLDHIDD